MAGQVFKFSGSVSEEGSLTDNKTTDEHYAIVTYWGSFEAHEKSHADAVFYQRIFILGEHVLGNQRARL